VRCDVLRPARLRLLHYQPTTERIPVTGGSDAARKTIADALLRGIWEISRARAHADLDRADSALLRAAAADLMTLLRKYTTAEGGHRGDFN